jgi:serine phosphatase RsbU (regulator of sigma subunit)
MKTATEVGGDYYDFSTKEDGSLNICLGDATGHGMKAGTIVSMMKSLFTGISAANDISEFFILSNNALKNSELDKMMMAFGMINIQENKIRISNAGIPPIFIFRSASRSVEEIKLNGLPLGAMKNTKYDSHNTDVSTGDIILMLSDGMPELRNGNDEMFGYERIKELFGKIGDKSANEIIQYLKLNSTDWVKDKDPDDDVTFVVIKVK